MDWGILIILNNYLHDVASATLLSSAAVLYVLDRQARLGGAGERQALARAYRTLTRFAWGALAWIIIGGIPRTIFFYQYEFIPADTRGIVADLVIKHILLVSAVIAGGIMWIRIGRNARAVAAAAPPFSSHVERSGGYSSAPASFISSFISLGTPSPMT